jgi:hypothetical protein
MLEFYTVERFDRCEFQQDGDMLLFQWGDSASLDGPGTFSLDITRQLTWSDREEDDPEIWQLSVGFVFPLGEAGRAAGSSNRWCRSPSELESFRAFVTSSPAFEAFADDSSVAPRITFESAE